MFVEQDERPHILVIDPDSWLKVQLDMVLNGMVLEASELSELDIGVQDFIIEGFTDYKEGIAHIEQWFDSGLQYPLVFIEYEQGENTTGLDLIMQLWNKDPDMHFILCSADKTLSWELIMQHVGQSDQLLFLQKPAGDLELRQAVHAMTRKWQLSKQSQNVMSFLEAQVKQRTLEIEAANKKLLQSEKLASVGQLAAGVAHEINTPSQYLNDNITAIKDYFLDLSEYIGFVQQQLTKLDTGSLNECNSQADKLDLAYIMEDMPSAIEQSQHGIKQISRIVQAMKGFSHMGQDQITRFSLNTALENTLIIAKSNYKYIADAETAFTQNILIDGYPGELNQVFLNLITNAAHAIEEKQQGRGLITITTRLQDDHAIISIGDTGTGIPEQAKDKIFDPFFTTKDIGKGTGQGLNIAYTIITEKHKGEITFESTAGEGTTFVIRLPIHHTESAMHDGSIIM